MATNPAARDAITDLTPDVRSFLGSVPRYATIATINADGGPHQVVIWFLLRDDRIVVNSRHGRRWPSNLRRDPRASLSVHEGEDAVTLECTVEEAYEGSAAQADIAQMARQHYTPQETSRAIARYETEPRRSFLLRPTRIHVHGDPR